MANTLGVVHPGLMAKLATRFYPSSCTIQEASESRDGFGAISRTWSNLSGHVSIACSVAEPPPEGEEIERTEQSYVVTRKRIALNGSYTSITEQHRAVVGGVNYDIERVRHDSQTKTTYLDVQVVT